MANKRIKDLTERTTLAAGDYLATDNDNGTRKVNASKILTSISTAQSTADNVATKVSNSGDAFSSSKGYSVGELCIYNNKVYRCKTAYSTGASWSSRSSNFEQVTLTDAITDLNNDLNGKENKLQYGSNTNGQYIVIGNLQICWGLKQVGGSGSAMTSIQFPRKFSNTPSVTANSTSTGAISLTINVANIGTASCVLYSVGANNTWYTGGVICEWIAVGVAS